LSHYFPPCSNGREMTSILLTMIRRRLVLFRHSEIVGLAGGSDPPGASRESLALNSRSDDRSVDIFSEAGRRCPWRLQDITRNPSDGQKK
jgi:hypothetical protein